MGGNKKPDDGEFHRETHGGVIHPWELTADLICNARRRCQEEASLVPLAIIREEFKNPIEPELNRKCRCPGFHSTRPHPLF